MGARDFARFFGLNHPSKPHEAVQVVLVRPPGLGAGQIGKPLSFGRHVRQAGKFQGAAQAVRAVQLPVAMQSVVHQRALKGGSRPIDSIASPACRVWEDAANGSVQPFELTPDSNARLIRTHHWRGLHGLAYLLVNGLQNLGRLVGEGVVV